MIYAVHVYFRKRGGRKAPSKFEGVVFAKDREHAEELVKGLLSDFPVEIDGAIHAAGSFTGKALEEIYRERPELRGISPEQGYIYDEFRKRHDIKKYVG